MPPRSVGEGLAPPENEKMMEERFKFKRLISIYKNAFLVSCVIFAGGASPSPTGMLHRIPRAVHYLLGRSKPLLLPVYCTAFVVSRVILAGGASPSPYRCIAPRLLYRALSLERIQSNTNDKSVGRISLPTRINVPRIP